MQKQTLHMLETMLQQNYFQYNRFYKPTKEVAMGSSISELIAEIFLQYCKQLIIKHHLENKSLIFSTPYVDDILIIYEQTRVDYNQILHHANSVHCNLLFNITQETDAAINLLDLLIHRTNLGIEIEIYRKPTSTEAVIHFTSKHPYEHKLAVFRFLLARMHQLLVTPQHKQKE
jgi:hypothetical protein